ncbi:MAG: NUDIX hydrolase [Micrococcales bacterium]|nr:NUDIX hydrolase [Micrococcales bacterium]
MSDQRDLSDAIGLSEVNQLDKQTVFSGRIWNVVRSKFNFYGEEISREYIEHPGAVAVFALNSSNEVLLIRQYRAPVNEFLLEIPAGLLDVAGEDKLDTAKRELREEADYEAKHWELLQEFHTTPGSSSETITIFLARELTPLAEKFDRSAEEKHLEVSWVPFAELLSAVRSSAVKSPTLVVATLAFAAKIDEDV